MSDLNTLYTQRCKLDPTYGDRVREAQWATYSGDDWDMNSAFLDAVKSTAVAA